MLTDAVRAKSTNTGLKPGPSYRLKGGKLITNAPQTQIPYNPKTKTGGVAAPGHETLPGTPGGGKKPVGGSTSTGGLGSTAGGTAGTGSQSAGGAGAGEETFCDESDALPDASGLAAEKTSASPAGLGGGGAAAGGSRLSLLGHGVEGGSTADASTTGARLSSTGAGLSSTGATAKSGLTSTPGSTLPGSGLPDNTVPSKKTASAKMPVTPVTGSGSGSSALGVSALAASKPATSTGGSTIGATKPLAGLFGRGQPLEERDAGTMLPRSHRVKTMMKRRHLH